MASILGDLFRHNRWANHQMVMACASLSDEQLDTSVLGTYGSIRDTLTHLAAAEAGYVTRLTGRPRLLAHEDPFPGMDRVAELLEESGAALEKLAETTDRDEIVEIQRQDQTVRVPAFILLLQSINHATDHRSHISTILTQLGISPPELDLWDYNSEVLGG